MQIKRLLKNKKILIALIILLVVIIALIITLIVTHKNTNKVSKDGYYYTFVEDDNLVTQSVSVYDSNDVLQTNYYLFYNGNPISYTTGESAVVTIARVDLNNKYDLEISFSKDTTKKYKVVYRKE